MEKLKKQNLFLEILSLALKTPRVINEVIRNILILCLLTEKSGSRADNILSLGDIILVIVLKLKILRIYQKFSSGELMLLSHYRDGDGFEGEILQELSQEDKNLIYSIFDFWGIKIKKKEVDTNKELPEKKVNNENLYQSAQETIDRAFLLKGKDDVTSRIKRIWYSANSILYFHIFDESHRDFFTARDFEEFWKTLQDSRSNYAELIDKIDKLLDSDIKILPFLAYLEDRIGENTVEEKEQLFGLFLYLLYRKNDIQSIAWESSWGKVKWGKIFEKYVENLSQMAFQLMKNIPSLSTILKIYDEFYSVLLPHIDDETSQRNVVEVYLEILDQYLNHFNTVSKEEKLSKLYCKLYFILQHLIYKFSPKERVKNCFSAKDELLNLNCSESLIEFRDEDSLKIEQNWGRMHILDNCLRYVSSKFFVNEVRGDALRALIELSQSDDKRLCQQIQKLYIGLLKNLNNREEKILYYWGIYFQIIRIFKCLYCEDTVI